MALSGTAQLYIAATVASIVLAWILIAVSRSSNPIKTAPTAHRPLETYGSPDVSDTIELRRTLAESIDRSIGSKKRTQEVVNAVADVFDRELEKRISTTAQEISTKYEKVIEQKTQNEEIAWKRYEKTLSQKKDTDAVIRSIAEWLVVVDAKGKVVMMNPAAERLLGVSKREKLGHDIKEGVRDDQLVSMVKTQPGAENREIELNSSEEQTKKILRASSAVIENENGQAVGMVSVLSDITKQKELDRLKATFVANVSHELRTPIIAIDKSISLILSKATGPLTGEQTQFLTIAERNLKRLSRLINDLLDLSKLEAGKMSVNRTLCSINTVISDAVDGVEQWAKTKGITLNKDVQADLPAVNMDPDKIIQVLTNLIGNSIKFTPEGKSVTVGAQLNGSSEIRVSVRDEGIGIPAEHLSHVFDKFFQVGERLSTDIHGTGIGLAISKEIVQMHGGTIWAESEHGKGAVFTFTLPVKT